mgnify:CR=1 FL=1
MNCHTFHFLRHVCPIFGPSRNQRRPFLLLFALYPARFVHPVYVHFVLFVLPYTLHAHQQLHRFVHRFAEDPGKPIIVFFV